MQLVEALVIQVRAVRLVREKTAPSVKVWDSLRGRCYSPGLLSLKCILIEVLMELSMSSSEAAV